MAEERAAKYSRQARPHIGLWTVSQTLNFIRLQKRPGVKNIVYFFSAKNMFWKENGGPLKSAEHLELA